MENVYVVNGIHCWHTTHLRGKLNNNKKFIYHLKMPSERLNEKKKKIYFSNLRIEFILISNYFLPSVWLPRKWRKTICDSTIEAWSHTPTYTTHDLQDPQVPK